MTEEPYYIRMAKLELRRLEREEENRRIDQELAKRKQLKRERYLNAPVMNLEGKVIGRKSLSSGEKA